MVVRQMTTGDVPAVAALDARLFGAQAYSVVALRQLVDLFPSLAWAAGDDGLQGYALGAVDERGEGWVLSLAVSPEARRQGVGRSLAVALLNALDARGVAATWLTVAPANAAARTLYAALGFTVGDVVRDCFGAGEDRLRLRRGGQAVPHGPQAP